MAWWHWDSAAWRLVIPSKNSKLCSSAFAPPAWPARRTLARRLGRRAFGAWCARRIPLEVCPSSNVCLGVAPSLAAHPLPQLLDAGLFVTINSDDPPMFNTTLTGEYLALARAFNLDHDVIERLAFNALRAALLLPDEKARLEADFTAAFAQL